MYFDGSSGGVCRVGVITKDGIDREVIKFHYHSQVKLIEGVLNLTQFIFLHSYSTGILCSN